MTIGTEERDRMLPIAGDPTTGGAVGLRTGMEWDSNTVATTSCTDSPFSGLVERIGVVSWPEKVPCRLSGEEKREESG